MSGQVVSKNMYELLGNDPELDPDRPADPPTKAIDKPVQRHGKRDGTDAPRPVPERVGNQSRAKQTNSANENAFRDRDVGAARNRGRGSGEPVEGGHRGGQRGRGRGGRGGRGGARGNDDRHSKTGVADNEKQAAHGWGGNDGNAELEDEQAGEAIAKAEEKEANAEDAAEIAEPEPEDKSKSYTAYLAELAEKKLSLGAQNVRQANEGSSKKFPEGKALDRQEEEDFFAAQAGKTKRERQRKEKVHVELDGDRMLAPPPREGGGRGRGRGRGEGRGEFRGRGEGRGDFRGGERRGGAEGRGGRGRGDGARGRGEGRGRGGRGGQSGPNITDSSAFPSLGA